jgi:hypothetical protein
VILSGLARSRAQLSPETRARVARIARGVPFRLAVAIGVVAIHLIVLVQSGKRFDAPWNAAPGKPPAFNNPAAEANPQRWNRLIVSRWDVGQYVELGLRGYQYCPPRSPTGALPSGTRTCNLTFYPTYALLGRAASFGGRIPIDYALFGVSLLAAFIFLFLWTDDALVGRLGLVETYLALLLFNTFTTAFTIVTPLTEATTLALTMGAFVAFTRRWWILAALLAGAAGSIRITGVATGAACGIALLVETWQNHPPNRAAWARRAATILLCAWGAAALMAYHYVRFGDALAYIHAHGKAFGHEPSLSALLHVKTEKLIFSIENPLHEGVWLAAALLWFLLGHREALRRFPAPEAAFWYTVFYGTVGIAAIGMAPIAFTGMTRYLLLALPVFFAMAVLMRPRPAVLILWLLLSGWHYWHVDACYYSGGPGNHAIQVCGAPHWVGRL